MAIFIPYINQVDPSRTLSLRNQFVQDFRARFRLLIADINEAIVDLDVLGLEEVQRIEITEIGQQGPVFLAANLSPKQFNFANSDQKIEAFIQWLQAKTKQYLLSGGRRGIAAFGDLEGTTIDTARTSWMNTYIDSAYQRGIRRARQELKKAGVEINDGSLGGDPIRVAFNTPMHLDRVGMIYTRSFSSLKGITAQMDSIVSDILAIGMAEGRGPREIASAIRNAFTGEGKTFGITDSLGRFIPARRRAEILARTEVMRSHHAANMGEYRAAGLMGIQIQVEYLIANDDRVCPQCAPLNGNIYTLEEAEHLLPRHPQCRCVALPYIPEDKE